MRHRSIEIDGLRHKAPIPMAAAIGPLLCTSAIMGIDPTTDHEPADPAAQITLAFRNLEHVLHNAGFSAEDVVHLAVLLSSDDYRELVNEQWTRMFPVSEDRPARHTTLTAFKPGRVVQLEAICFKDSGES